MSTPGTSACCIQSSSQAVSSSGSPGSAGGSGVGTLDRSRYDRISHESPATAIDWKKLNPTTVAPSSPHEAEVVTAVHSATTSADATEKPRPWRRVRHARFLAST